MAEVQDVVAWCYNISGEFPYATTSLTDHRFRLHPVGLSIYEMASHTDRGVVEVIDLILDEWQNIGMPEKPKSGDGIIIPIKNFFAGVIILNEDMQYLDNDWFELKEAGLIEEGRYHIWKPQ